MFEFEYVPPAGDSELWAWLQKMPPSPRPLAWCHMTRSFEFFEMLKQGFFEPKPCPVFKEDLVYFFYGRPAYRLADVEAQGMSSVAPAVIVLDPESVRDGKRLFPFDTGAFAARRYAQWLHPSMQLSDFELKCPSDAAQRHIHSFFGSNLNYLRVRAQAPEATSLFSFVIDAIAKLLTDRNAVAADDRRATLEMQTAKPIPFTYPVVRGLILPDELAARPEVQHFQAESGGNVVVSPYPLTAMRPTCEYQVHLEYLAEEMQKRWGML